MKRLILCADDYGQSASISNGILHLLEQNRLSAVSCMTNFPDWAHHAALLSPYLDQVDIGLHLNLTDGPLHRIREQPLSYYLRNSVRGRLPLERIYEEFESQLHRFTSKFNRLPNFIDGHQHIHQLRGLSELLQHLIDHYFGDEPVYIRNTSTSLFDGSPNKFKRFIINLFGGYQLKHRFSSETLNNSFSGIYAFKNVEHYSDYFDRFLQASNDLGLIMCHPGLADEKSLDPLSNSRPKEYAFLSSPEFQTLCEKNNFKLSRFSDI